MKYSRLAGLLLLGVFLMGTMQLSAQKVSEKKEIAVFNLSFYDTSIPPAALGSIDEQIRSVFIKIGRFEVLGLNQRLSNRDVNEFVEKIKDFKQRNVKIPEKVLMGQEAFTERDFNRLVGAFIVVVPAVTFFNQETLKDGSTKASIQTSFTFINVEEAKAIAQFYVESSGSDKNARNAVKSAVDSIPVSLTYEIRKVPAFQISTGIIQVAGSDAVVELGSNMGIMVGDEYAVISAKVVAGYEAQSDAGLLIVKEVQDKFSVAQIIYADRQIMVGDQLKEIPRIGAEIMPYASAVFGKSGSSQFLGYLGLKGVASRGFFSMRPVFGLEVPLGLESAIGILFNILPVNVYLGAELTNLYLGRLQLAPTIVLGMGGAGLGPDAKANFNTDQDFIMTHFGGKAFVSVNWLATRDMKVSVDAGAAAWFSWVEYLLKETKMGNIDGSVFATRVGPYIGLGVTFK